MTYLQQKPGVYFSSDRSIIGSDDQIQFLSSVCENESLSMARICFHNNHDSPLMVMLIVVISRFVYPAHKHIWKDELYTLLQGTCFYEQYTDSGLLEFRQPLLPSQSFLNCNKAFHSIVPTTDLLAFLEVTTGPFTNQSLEIL